MGTNLILINQHAVQIGQHLNYELGYFSVKLIILNIENRTNYLDIHDYQELYDP